MDQGHARWAQGMALVILVALIWITASYIVAYTEDSGLPAFVLTLICNSLFMIFIPIAEFSLWSSKDTSSQSPTSSSQLPQWGDGESRFRGSSEDDSAVDETSQPLADRQGVTSHSDGSNDLILQTSLRPAGGSKAVGDAWTRLRIAWVSLAICPPWFLAQLTFNLSLALTSVSVSERCPHVFDSTCCPW